MKSAKIYLVLTPDEEGPAANGLFTPAHLAYRIGRDFKLYRAQGRFYLRRGLMIVDSAGQPSAAAGSELAGQILRECMLMNYEGVMLDLSGQLSHPMQTMLSALQPSLERQGFRLYLPAGCHCSTNALRIETAAPYDGNATALLKKMSNDNRKTRFSVNLPVRHSQFPLPGRGSGRSISLGEAQRLAGDRAFYSQELQAMYAIISRQGQESMLIWDDADTMVRRIRTAQNAGAESIFIIWAEVKPFWSRLEELLQGVNAGSDAAEAKQNANHR